MQKTLYGILVWFLATLFVVYAFCLNTAAAVFSEVVKTSLHLTSVGTTLAVGSFIVGFAVMQIPAGYLLDKYNPRYVVSIGVLILAIGNLLISHSAALWSFTLANFLQGMGASFAFIAAGILISQWFPAKLFPILFGLTQTMSCVLAGFIHYVFMLELKVHTWNEVYQNLSWVGFLLFILILVFVKKCPTFNLTQNLTLTQSLSITSKNPQIWLCSLAAATSFGVLLSYAGFWYVPIQKYYLVGDTDMLIISGLMFVGIGIGTPILGWLSNLMHSRKLILHFSLVVGTMFLLLGIYLPHFEIATLIIVKTVSLLIGLLLSGSMLFYTVVSEISSDSTRGVALSITNTAVFLTNTLLMFLPVLFVTKHSVDFFTYLWVLPFFTMISLLLLYFIKESYKKL